MVSESSMKDGKKFLVFCSENDDNIMAADLICVTVDSQGKAHIFRKIHKFY